MDEADSSDSKIEAVQAQGIEAARAALRTPKVLPIGVCHYCESPVAPKHLFCPIDEVEPEQSCSVLWEVQQKMLRATGR